MPLPLRPLLVHHHLRVSKVQGFTEDKYIELVADRVGWLTSSSIMMVLLMWWCMKCVLDLVWFVALPWQTLVGHSRSQTILGKEMRYVLGMVFGGASRAALLLDLPCFDF